MYNVYKKTKKEDMIHAEIKSLLKSFNMDFFIKVVSIRFVTAKFPHIQTHSTQVLICMHCMISCSVH